MRKVGPRVLELLKEFSIAVKNIVVAAAPLGAVVLETFIKFLEVFNDIPQSGLSFLLNSLAAFATLVLTIRGMMSR